MNEYIKGYPKQRRSKTVKLSGWKLELSRRKQAERQEQPLDLRSPPTPSATRLARNASKHFTLLCAAPGLASLVFPSTLLGTQFSHTFRYHRTNALFTRSPFSLPPSLSLSVFFAELFHLAQLFRPIKSPACHTGPMDVVFVANIVPPSLLSFLCYFSSTRACHRTFRSFPREGLLATGSGGCRKIDKRGKQREKSECP